VDVVRIIYGENGASAAPVLGFLSLLGALSCFQYVNLSFLNASGRPSLNFLFTLTRAVAINALLLLSNVQHVAEIVLIFAVTEAVLFPVSIVLATKVAGLSIFKWFGRMWGVVLAAIAMYAVMVTLGANVFASLPSLARVAILGPAGALTFVLIVWVLDGRRIMHLIRGSVAEARG
jgi:O-antigen/teichoic acid export membrane protein